MLDPVLFFFLVVIFRFLEVIKLVLRQEKWDDHFKGVLFFPHCFSCSISLREMFFFKFGGTNCGRISFGFL